jgi:hypothetical protein
MQGLADGYFCIATIGDYLAQILKQGKISTDLRLKQKNNKARIERFITIMVRIL